jgi:hypothetical protein
LIIRLNLSSASAALGRVLALLHRPSLCDHPVLDFLDPFSPFPFHSYACSRHRVQRFGLAFIDSTCPFRNCIFAHLHLWVCSFLAAAILFLAEQLHPSRRLGNLGFGSHFLNPQDSLARTSIHTTVAAGFAAECDCVAQVSIDVFFFPASCISSRRIRYTCFPSIGICVHISG